MSKVYESESFYKPFLSKSISNEGNSGAGDINCDYIDCADITGVNCYADDSAVNLLRQRLRNVDIHGLHFIDSGNFHYLTYIFLNKIETDFVLVLIDKHPDCKKPLFENMLSCGGWVRDAFMNITHLKHVYMIGVSSELLDELFDLDNYMGNVTVIGSASELTEELSRDSLPIYLSIDKDALDESVVTTNWDQGNMTLDELDAYLDCVVNSSELLGVDICGEPSISDICGDAFLYSKSDEVNAHLLSYFLNFPLAKNNLRFYN